MSFLFNSGLRLSIHHETLRSSPSVSSAVGRCFFTDISVHQLDCPVWSNIESCHTNDHIMYTCLFVLGPNQESVMSAKESLDHATERGGEHRIASERQAKSCLVYWPSRCAVVLNIMTDIVERSKEMIPKHQ